MPNAEVLKDACNYVAFELKDVAVLNYLGANTRASNIDRVNRALEPEGQGPSRARVVIGESQKIAMATGSIYANLDTVRHVGRLTRDKKAGECDHFACAILEGMLNNEDFQQQAPKIEILANGGHAFVVVNRRDETELNEIDNWQDAILVDVWKYNQGVDTEPVWWATESQSLRTYARANLIRSLFLFDVSDWLLV